jgi:hypothetical protein
MTDVLDLETVTTVPIIPLEHPAFIEAALTPEEPENGWFRESDPWWFVCMVLIGALCSIGSGTFMIALQLKR